MVYPHTYRTEHSETVTTNSTYGEYYRKHEDNKISIQEKLIKILQYVDSHRITYLKNLAEAIEIKSVSGQIKYRDEIIKMIKFVERWLKRLNVKYECFNVGYKTLDDGKKYRIPPVILGTLGKDPKKKTVCVYSYLDVLPVCEDKWDTDPWKLIEKDKMIFGRGLVCGKAPLISWFHLVESFQKREVEMPVNLKFLIESQHHQDSIGLPEFLATRKQDFFYNVDYFVVCESEWLGDKHPCIVYGTVGILRFELTIEKKEGNSTEIKDDMANIFSTITDDKEDILIPNFNQHVDQITPDEEFTYEKIQEFDPEEIRATLPPHKQKWDKVNILMHLWRLPSIHLGEIQECMCEKQDFSKIKRSFTIKIVPRQLVDNSVQMVMDQIEQAKKDFAIENEVRCSLLKASRPWYEDYRSPNYVAAKRATIQIYKEDPSMIREDRDMKILQILHRVLDKSILVLPLYRRGTNKDGDNEHIGLKNYYEGTKLLAAYLFQVEHVGGGGE